MLNGQPPPEPETFCEGPDRANVFFCPLTWAKLIFFYPSQHGPSNFFSCPPDRTKLIFICVQPNPSYNFFAHPFPPPAGQNFPKFYSCSIASNNEFVTNKKSDDNFAWKVKEQKFLKGLPFLLTLLPPPFPWTHFSFFRRGRWFAFEWVILWVELQIQIYLGKSMKPKETKRKSQNKLKFCNWKISVNFSGHSEGKGVGGVKRNSGYVFYGRPLK